MFLYRLNKKFPMFSSLILLIFCSTLRIVEVFIYQFDENFVQTIYSGFLGLMIILLFSHYTKNRFSEIGLSSRRFADSLPMSSILVFSTLFLSYGSQYLFLHLNNMAPFMQLNNYTWIQFILYVWVGHMIASLLEEGLFRGILLRGFMQNWSFLFSNCLQALLFTLWHLIALFKKYTINQINLNEVFFLSMMAGSLGLLMGYIYYLTANLWVNIVWHIIWYVFTDMFVIQSFTSTNNKNLILLSENLFWVAFLFASVLSILLLHIRNTVKARLYINN